MDPFRNYDACLRWQGSHTRNGYGIRYPRGRGRTGTGTRLVHRWVWEQTNGPVPPGMVVMHTCDTRDCFLYAHLRLGTVADNQRDMAEKGRSTALTNRERCESGRHVVADVGFYVQKNGRRSCKACHAERTERYLDKKREQT